MPDKYREIPYNYTSFSDREIVIRFMGEDAWEAINHLRSRRKSGRSARYLFELLGDMWIVVRNPFIFDDLLNNPRRKHSLIETLDARLAHISERANGNPSVLRLHKQACQAVASFTGLFAQFASDRARIIKAFNSITHTDNIRFDGHARVAHVTDATDWRVEYPFVVITPDNESEMADIVMTCIQLGLTIIPRGGGTGYTGSAVPLEPFTAVINTEKLDHLSAVEVLTPAGLESPVATICAGAGVVTQEVSKAAARKNLVFAVDPTSQDASTIGGNVAMNAGGKKAVLWGTTLDNLLSWTMVTPDGVWMEVSRRNHNLGKIHEQEEAEFKIERWSDNARKALIDVRSLKISGKSFRHTGLGKDVTDKFLSGLPGVQKEGCDGLITSARFILHRSRKSIHTVCLEFYNYDLRTSVPAIVQLRDELAANPAVDLAGLEHLDWRYIKAVNYTPKSAHGTLPRMVLLADISSDDTETLSRASQHLLNIALSRGGEGFIATTAAARARFWAARKRTAAIAAHTNAFKINEDVVIPLEYLGEYSLGIERINIEQSISNKLATIEALSGFLSNKKQVFDCCAQKLQLGSDEPNEQIDILESKRQTALKLLEDTKVLWSKYADNLDTPIEDVLPADVLEPFSAQSDQLIDLILRNELRISLNDTLINPLERLFGGLIMQGMQSRLADIHSKYKQKRLFVALHMHAGDGNVHSNIPVNSSDYEMLAEADRIVDRIMALALSLDGVISGEHGIGLTKLKYMSANRLEPFVKYKEDVDPKQHFNKGKLLPGSGLANAYTPSFRLLETEALILENSDLGTLNEAIKDCLRCGKCKPECTTHVPGANLLYSPRNKILASGQVIEAMLYEEQTRRGISINHFDEMNDIADHCTICHRCLAPCPVNIDFGDVTVLTRKLLIEHKQRRTHTGTKLAMHFLNITDPRWIRFMRFGFIQMGYAAQRFTSQFARRFKLLSATGLSPKSTTGKPNVMRQLVQFNANPLPVLKPAKTLRALLQLENSEEVPVLSFPDKLNSKDKAVFYFPGCGSERLFSEVGLATIATLAVSGMKVILPPAYLCCGYPQKAQGETERAHQINTQNRVLFHRLAATLADLDVKHVVASCGTCMDQLLDYQFDRIFPGCRQLDIHEYMLENDIRLPEVPDTEYIYHEPCHDPMKHHESLEVASTLLGKNVLSSDRCCGESGTFAISRPDIAQQVRHKKLAS
ncbi:MAG: DUF3683 domain-containing protein, partial [Proteobacteria bacterium]|nr:DUF3683 domain-containing protein [Pseudomonadota bacterium]